LSESEATLLARFEVAMEDIYHVANSEIGYNANRFLVMVKQLGGLQAAHHLLAGDHIHDGFAELLLAGRPDLTVEALVLRDEFQSLFSEEELRVARERLGR
jgi:hypothetical protein